MPGGCFFPGLDQRDLFFVGACFFQYLPGGVPVSIRHLAEVPGVAFFAGKVATGLINRQIILRAGQMDGGDQALDLILFEL